jgi:hypothetical protein
MLKAWVPHKIDNRQQLILIASWAASKTLLRNNRPTKHLRFPLKILNNVAIPFDLLGTEHADFSPDSGVFFIHNLFITRPILIRQGAEYP